MSKQLITAISFENNSNIFGLGEDSKVYYWDVDHGKWKLNVNYSHVAE